MPLNEKFRLFQLWMVVSAMIAYWIEPKIFSIRFGLAFACVFVAVGAASWTTMKILLASAQTNNKRFQQSIDSLSFDQAKLKCAELLADPNHYRAIVRSTPLVPIDMHSSLLDVFGPFEAVFDSAGYRLSLGQRTGDYIELGVMDDEVRLVARVDDGGIFEVWPDQPGPGNAPDYPSLQHWLVISASD